jgi:hypothetical protein
MQFLNRLNRPAAEEFAKTRIERHSRRHNPIGNLASGERT